MTQRDFSGWSGQTGFGAESTYGDIAAATTTNFGGKILTCGIQSDSSVIKHRSKTSGRNIGDQLPGRVKVSGPVEISPQDGLFLEYAFGAIVKGAKGDGTATPVHAVAGTDNVVSGCNIEEQASPDMTLKLAASGTFYQSSSLKTTTAIATITIGAAHATLDRVDVVSIKDTAGTTSATVTAGTAAASPVPDWASVPTDELVVALVWVGATVTAINTTDVRQIFWATEANTLSSISVEDSYINPEGTATDDIVRVFTGCKVNEFSYSVSREQTEAIKFAFNFIGKRPYTYDGSGRSASTITESSAGFFLEWNTQLTVASGTSYDLNDFSFTMNNNLKARGTDGRFISKLVEGTRMYTSSAKIDLLDKEEVEREYGASDATTPGTTIGTFAIKHALIKPEYERMEFLFSNCTYNKTPTSDPLEDLIQQDLDINIKSCEVMIVDASETY